MTADWAATVEAFKAGAFAVCPGAESVLSTIGLPICEAAVTEEPSVLFVWDRGLHHLQVEVYPAGTYDWFYRRRGTEGSKGGEGIPHGEIGPDLSGIARFFAEEQVGPC